MSTMGYEWSDWGAGTEGGELSPHWVNEMLTGSDLERFSHSFNAAVRKSVICFAATLRSGFSMCNFPEAQVRVGIAVWYRNMNCCPEARR